MSGAEAPRYSDGRLMHLAAGMPITDEHREIVRTYLGTVPGEVVTAEMVNRAIELDRAGAVPADQLGAEQSEQDLPPSAAAERVAERAAFRERLAERQQAGGTWRPGEGPVRLDWSQVTRRAEGDNRPVEFPPASVLDPAPAERLAGTVAEVRALRLLSEQSRREALHAAALVYQGRAHDVGTDAVLEAAADFEAYLRGDEVPTPVVVPPRPLVELGPTDRPVTRVAGYTFDDLRALDADVAQRLAGHLDAALAEDRVERGTGPLVRTALAILRRQR